MTYYSLRAKMLAVMLCYFVLMIHDQSFGQMYEEASIITKRPPELEGATLHHPAISPDGKLVAFSVFDESSNAGAWQNSTIWVQELFSGKTWPLTQPDTTNFFGDVCVQWSPDGTRLSYASDKNQEVHINIINVDGSGLLQITEETITEGNSSWFGISSWSKDGKKIIYPQGETESKRRGIYAYNLDTQTTESLHLFPQQTFQDPDISPDGNQIVYVVGNGLEILDLSTKTSRTLECNISAPRMPKWSPDGNWIGFQVNAGGMWKTYILPSKGGIAIRVGPGIDYWSQVPTWSNDGQSIVFHAKKLPKKSIVFRNMLTSREFTYPTEIIGNAEWYWTSWSDNGDKVAFNFDIINNNQITRLSVLNIENDTFIDTVLIYNHDKLKSAIPNWKSKIGGWVADTEHFVGIAQQDEYTQLALISAKTLDFQYLTNDLSVKSCPVISGDKELIAYVAEANGEQDIWIYDLVTDENYRLTFNNKTKWELRFSPDGDNILFGQDNGETHADIMMVETENGELTTIISEPGWEVNPNWIDRNIISYTKHPPSSTRQLIIQNLRDGTLKSITREGDIFIPEWHENSQTFYIHDLVDGFGILTVGINGKFRDLLSQGESGKPSPTGHYMAYKKREDGEAEMDIWIQKVDSIVSKSVLP